jgi:hypothetical protein
MSITLQIPEQYAYQFNAQGPNQSVETPSASPSGTLVSQRTLDNLSADQTAILAVQFPLGGEFLVISSVTVSGTPASSAAVPALSVSYSDMDPEGTGSVGYTSLGPASKGSGVVNGYNVTQSVSFTHDGLSAITAGMIGGNYTGDWTYSVTIKIYSL